MKWLLPTIFLVLGSLATSAAPTYQILITEIFADPTPSRGLPEKEYIELFNNSSEPVQLEDYILQYNTSEVAFPAFIIEPNAYVIVCRRGNGEFLEPYGDVIELSKFSLLNRGTTLTLLNNTGILSHSVTYSDDWYSPERDQGYSLEMIDTAFPCTGKSNWSSTLAEIGGTPGSENSIKGSNPDIAPPLLLSKIVKEDSVLLQFSEKLDEDVSLLEFEIVEGVQVASINIVENATAILITLNENLMEDRLYTLKVEGVFDCSGNIFEQTEVVLGNLPRPNIGELSLTEVLFDPFPDGEDFIEFQNTSNKVINLRGLQAWNLNNDNEPSDLVNLFTSDFLLEPQAVLCLSENKTQLLNFYDKQGSQNIVQIEELPSMNNSSGEIFLGFPEYIRVDSMSYDVDDHSSFIDDPEGVSLFKSNGQWSSSSGSIGYASPGWIPSLNNEQENYVVLSPEIVTPNGDGMDDDLKISIKTDSESVAVSATVYDRYGNQIASISNNLFLGNGGTLEWAPQGNRYQAGYYYVFVSLSFSEEVIEKKLPFVIAYYN